MQWEIKSLELEISSACNAACPSCSRSLAVGMANPYVKTNNHLPLSLVEKLGEAFPSNQIESVVFCGNYGDPIAHPYKTEIFRVLREKFPLAFFVVHTNGSLATLEQWRKIAEIFRDTPHRLRFAIDGLADTFSIYRRNISFDRVMRNAKEFIEAGGDADWKWIDFVHTRHQAAEAEKISREMGFASFSVVRDHSEFCEENAVPYDQSIFHNHPFVEQESYPSGIYFEESRCRAKKLGLIYVDAQGKIWPCCWMADGVAARHAWKRQALHGSINNLSDGFNSLHDHSLKEIVSHSFFDKSLPSSWQTPTPSNCGRICLFHCAGIEPSLSG
jgi:hypothetical protein